MKKLLCTIISVSLIFLCIPSAAMAQKVLKIGLGDPEGSDQWVLATRFKELVEDRTKGKIEVQVFPGGSLGSEQEMVQNARLGILDMAVVAINNITPFSPRLGVLTLPYMIQSHYDAAKITSGALADQWSETAQKDVGVRILGWCYSNFRVLTNSKKPVRTIADLKGLKIRVPKNAIMIASYQAWGVNPIPLAWDETFTAMQQKVVDGQDNPYIVNYTMKFHEVQKYVTNLHYLYSLQPLVIGDRFFKRQPKEIQDILINSGREAQQHAMLFQVMEANKAKENLIAGGMQVMDLEDEQKWVKLAVDKVWPKFYKSVGGKAEVDKVVKALGR